MQIKIWAHLNEYDIQRQYCKIKEASRERNENNIPEWTGITLRYVRKESQEQIEKNEGS